MIVIINIITSIYIVIQYGLSEDVSYLQLSWPLRN